MSGHTMYIRRLCTPTTNLHHVTSLKHEGLHILFWPLYFQIICCELCVCEFNIKYVFSFFFSDLDWWSSIPIICSHSIVFWSQCWMKIASHLSLTETEQYSYRFTWWMADCSSVNNMDFLQFLQEVQNLNCLMKVSGIELRYFNFRMKYWYIISVICVMTDMR
jgi:hypothetical protein